MTHWILKVLTGLLLAYIIQIYFNDGQKDPHLEGFVDPLFEPVFEAFRLNLIEGWERGGGAFTVYHKGKKVIDIYGGYADRSSQRLWKQNTLNVAFSCTKALAALCVAKLVEDGHVEYDNLVTDYWKEFGKNGKDNVTVRWLVSHKAGLAYTDHNIPFDVAINPIKISKIFEEQKPNWPPGTEIGYHAVTYGWIIDQLIRRVDPLKRSIGQYFREEFAQKLNLDFYIGLPKSEYFRVSRLSTPSILNVLQEILHQPSHFNIRYFLTDMFLNGTLSKVGHNIKWIGFVKELTLNNPDLWEIEQAAVLGIGTARSMAALFEKVRDGSLLKKETVDLLISGYEKRIDVVTSAYVPRGQGLMIKEYQRNGKTFNLYGHSGYGGQNVRIDFDNELTFAYMSNALKVGFGDTARTYIRLLDTLYDVIEGLSK